MARRQPARRAPKAIAARAASTKTNANPFVSSPSPATSPAKNAGRHVSSPAASRSAGSITRPPRRASGASLLTALAMCVSSGIASGIIAATIAALRRSRRRSAIAHATSGSGTTNNA